MICIPESDFRIELICSKNRAKMYFKSCILLILFASDSLSISLDADNSQFDEIKKEIKQLEGLYSICLYQY